MSDLSYGTAGLLFPAISLATLSCANRCLGLTSAGRSPAIGVLSLFLCAAGIGRLPIDSQVSARVAFAGAHLLMLVAPSISLREIHRSVRAIQINLDGLSEHT